MSVTPRSSRLASPFENLGSHYDAVVVGSGYGASIAASRLARAGQRVCVLERGREFQPGEYPDTTVEAAAQFQMDNEHGHFGSKTGLFDFRANKDIGVFLGCGLGGTSLVNAGVVLPAEPRVLADDGLAAGASRRRGRDARRLCAGGRDAQAELVSG